MAGPGAVNAMSVTAFDERDRLDEDALTVIVDTLAVAGRVARRMSSNRTHRPNRSGRWPAQAFNPKVIGLAAPSMTQASPWSKRSIRGRRWPMAADRRETTRSGGSLPWLSPEMRR
jgi:hypothetical protein